MIRNLLFITLAFACVFPAFSQRDYIKSDSLGKVAVYLEKGNPKDNTQFIYAILGGERKRLNSYNISEYGFADGTVYRAFPVNVRGENRLRFLERLYDGDRDLYFYKVKKRFYLHQGDSLIQIPKNDRPEFLKSEFSGCEKAQINVSHVPHNKVGLLRYLASYDQCSEDDYPRIRVGISAGVALNKINSINTLGFLYGQKFKFIAGKEVDFNVVLPIAKTNLAFVPGAGLSQYARSILFSTSTASYNLLINQIRWELPVLMRYQAYRIKGNPYLEAGVVYSKFIKGNNAYYSYSHDQNDIYVATFQQSFIPKSKTGMALNIGMVFRYSSDISYSLKLGYRHFGAQNRGEESIKLDQFVLSTGIYF